MLINQTLDSEWFRILGFMGLVAFALSGVLLAYEGQYTLFGAVMLAVLPAVGGGVVRDVLLQREPIGVVRDPAAILFVFATVIAGMIVIKSFALIRADRAAKYLKSQIDRNIRRRRACRLHRRWRRCRLGHLGSAVVAVGSSCRCHHGFIWRLDPGRVPARPRGRELARELYPEIAAVWGLAFAVFLEWEGERLQPDEITIAVIVTILGVFLTRILAIARGMKGWRYI